jgi:membrane associated rhomboid family serine protease
MPFAPIILRLDPAAGGGWARTAWMLAGAVVGLWLAERGAALLLLSGWLPARAVLDLTAAGRAHPDPTLFAPHQLWTGALLHAGVLHLVLLLPVLPAAAAAVERALGARGLLLALLALLPATVLAELALAWPAAVAGPVEPGLSGVVVGLLALVLGLYPRATAAWALGWYAVVRVGWRALPPLPLPLLIAGVVVADHLAALIEGRLPPAPAHAAGLVLGLVGGFLLRR